MDDNEKKLKNIWKFDRMLCIFAAENNGLVVQLVRIRACHARGRGFESRPDRWNEAHKVGLVFFKVISRHLLYKFLYNWAY